MKGRRRHYPLDPSDPIPTVLSLRHHANENAQPHDTSRLCRGCLALHLLYSLKRHVNDFP